jgi:hypothetical protein
VGTPGRPRSGIWRATRAGGISFVDT